MKAVRYHRWGDPSVLTIDDVPVPTPGPGQLRVRVRTLSVNPIDWKMMSGAYRLILSSMLPAVPCFDICGTVDAVGDGVDEFRPGDRVFVREPSRPGGAARELAIVEAAATAHAPEGVSDAVLAAVPLAGMTALQALRVGEGKRVLVIAASGGVGHLAVQLAHSDGAHVTGVCSGRNADFVRELGADEVIDYTQRDDLGGPYDVIIDGVGTPWAKLRPALAPGGKVALIAPTPALLARMAAQRLVGIRRLVMVMMTPTRADLSILSERLVDGRLRVEIADVLHGLESVQEALVRSKAGRTRGKLVVSLTAPQ